MHKDVPGGYKNEVSHISPCSGVTTACCFRGLAAVECFLCNGGRSVWKRGASLDSSSMASLCLLSIFALFSSSFCFSFNIFGERTCMSHPLKVLVNVVFQNEHPWKLGYGSWGRQYSLQLILVISLICNLAQYKGLTISCTAVCLTDAYFQRNLFWCIEIQMETLEEYERYLNLFPGLRHSFEQVESLSFSWAHHHLLQGQESVQNWWFWWTERHLNLE